MVWDKETNQLTSDPDPQLCPLSLSAPGELSSLKKTLFLPGRREESREGHEGSGSGEGA